MNRSRLTVAAAALSVIVVLGVAISHANPFFYVISGFRHGFLSEADSPIYVGGFAILLLNILLFGICYMVLKKGWKIKN